MGQAKLRGTREQRIAQAQERQAVEAAKAREHFLQSERERIAREDSRLKREEGIPRVMVVDSGTRNPRISNMLALAAMAIAGSGIVLADASISQKRAQG